MADLEALDVLLWLDTCGTRDLFANPNEAPDVVTQIGERLMVRSRNRSPTRGALGHPPRDSITP